MMLLPKQDPLLPTVVAAAQDAAVSAQLMVCAEAAAARARQVLFKTAAVLETLKLRVFPWQF